MKYNSIGEQLIAKAKELDPSYKPDKFNDMSEAINIILNNTGSGGGGGKSVPPTLNLIDFEAGGVRTTITEEEKTNLENGLYNQVIFPGLIPNELQVFIPSKLVGDKLFEANIFAQFDCVIGGDRPTITALSFYGYSFGAKDTSGNYPITIEKRFDIPVGDSGGGQSIEDLPVVELPSEITTVTDETIKAKILENVNNDNYLICKLKMPHLSTIEILITRDAKLVPNDIIENTVFTQTAFINLGLVAITFAFTLSINSKDGTIAIEYEMLDYIKGNQVSLFQKTNESFGVTTDYGDTNVINGLELYFDTINGKPIIHRDTTVNSYTFTEDKTISLFGKYSILVPNDSADANILPCSTADNGKVLSVVNGEAQWASVSGGLTLPQTAPTSQLIPSITTTNTQQNLTIGDGLTIENGVIKEDIIEINVSFELTQEDLRAGAVWKANVGTSDEGNKIWNSINSSTGLPKKAIINISLNVLGTTDLYKILANPYKDAISYGYNFNVGGFIASSSYLFVFGAVYINDVDDTIDAHLCFNQNLVQ